MDFFRPVSGVSTSLWQTGTPQQSQAQPPSPQPAGVDDARTLGQNSKQAAIFAPGNAGAANLLQSPQEAAIQMADAVVQRVLQKINQANNPFMPAEQRMQILISAAEDCEGFIETLQNGLAGTPPSFTKMLMMRFKELHRSVKELINNAKSDAGLNSPLQP